MRRLFSGLMRLKHLGVRIITCGLTEGRLNLPYNKSANMTPSMVSFLSESDLRSGLCTRAVQRVLTHWKFYPRNFTSAVQCPGPTRRKGKTNQAAWNGKTKVNAKGKHVNTREEAAACSAQDLRERPGTNASS